MVRSINLLNQLFKFRKEIATIQLEPRFGVCYCLRHLFKSFYNANQAFCFNICLWVGLLTRLEIIAIILALKMDERCPFFFYHALKLRHGKAIKRHKLFNG